MRHQSIGDSRKGYGTIFGGDLHSLLVRRAFRLVYQIVHIFDSDHVFLLISVRF